jgi:hypothetical protein
MKLTREQEAEHQATLRSSLGDHFGLALMALTQHDFERVKERLVDCAKTEFDALQGEAQAYKRILKYLKERPVATPKV